MMLTALYNVQIISDGAITTGKALIIDGDKITSVIPISEIPVDAERIDLAGAYLSPGLIDLQIYGAGGELFGGEPTVKALQTMEQVLMLQGCTGFFATVATNTTEVVLQAIEAAKEYRKTNIGNFLGLHLEGPFLNAARKGAHPANLIRKATIAEVKHWINLAEGEVKMITIAPELQDQEVIDYLQQQNIIISTGHSNATYTEAKSFLNKPIPAATHLFNAMPPLHHRDPGLIAAIFETRPYASIVADGNHVDFAMIRMAKRQLGNKLFLITDAVTSANKGVYQHILQGDKYVMPDGTLSGSSLSMLQAVKNCVENDIADLPESINMASLYPAELASLKAKGKVSAGYDADLIIFDSGFNISQTFFKGKIYKQPTTI